MSKTSKLFKIAIVMQSPDIGGAETYMLALIDNFLKQKTKIILVSNRGKFLNTASKFPIETIEVPYIMDIMGNLRGLIKTTLLLPFEFTFYVNLLSQFQKEKVDVILMSGFTEKLFVSIFAQFFKLPVVWIEYGRLETIFCRNFFIPKFVYSLCRNIPEIIIVPSKNTFESLRNEAKVSSEKLLLIPLGVSIGKKKKIVKEKLASQFKNKSIIGSVSRLTKEKGHEYLIRAMPHIIKKKSNTHLVIIGDGPDKKWYRRLVAELGISSFVTITGFIENLPDYYSIFDVFVFPTIWELEGFGLVTPEAMSYGIPVIASNIGPVPEIVDDKKTGILVQPKNEKAIADAVLDLLNSPKKRKKMGENAYQKARATYDITKNSSKMLEVLKLCSK